MLSSPKETQVRCAAPSVAHSFLISLTFNVIFVSTAKADEKIIFNTFGTVGYSVMAASKGGEEFNTDQNVLRYVPRRTSNYWGIDKEGTFDRDTRFGLNLGAPINKDIFFTAQVYAEASNQTTGLPEYFRARFSVMSLRFEPYRDVMVRFGLFQVPLWLVSEEKYVGYTYPYIRNPAEVQGLTRIGDTMRGISIAYNFSFKNWVIRPSMTYGSYVHANAATPEVQLPTDATMLFNNVSFEFENALFNVGYHFVKGRTRQDIDQVVRQDGVDVKVTLPNTLDYTGRNLGLGFKAEFKRLLLMAEYNHIALEWHRLTGFMRPLQGSTLRCTGAYGLIGIPMGKWMPRMHYAWFVQEQDRPDGALESFIDVFVNQNSSIPDVQKPIARQGIRAKGDALVGDIYRVENKQHTINIGLNYQWSLNVVLKVEAERVEAPGDSPEGVFGMKRNGRVDLVSTAVDFIY